MPFPSVLSTFNRPNATSRLDSPSHSALHNTVSSAVGQIEAVIGVEGAASVPGTLEYLIKSPASDGGGHIQTANKGGTGQTSYSKGDLLVATSSSVISKLGVSSTSGDVLVADPNQSTGMRWSPVVSNKIAIVNSVVSRSAAELGSSVITLYSTSVLGSVIGSANAIRFTGMLNNFEIGAGVFNLKASYGSNSVAIATINFGASVLLSGGTIEGMIIGNGATSQIGFIKMKTFTNNTANINQAPNNLVNPMQVTGYAYGTSSVDASAKQDLVITANYGSNNAKNSILTGMFVVEKIA